MVSPTLFFPHMPVDSDLWHCRFGHLGMNITQNILTKPYAMGINYDGHFMCSHCVPCIISKHPQQPYTHLGHCSSKVCDLIHMDTCGPFPDLLSRGTSLFIVFLDDHSNFGHTKLLARKSNTFTAYLPVKAHWEHKSGNFVIDIRSDGAKEFVEGIFDDYITKKGYCSSSCCAICSCTEQ